MLKTMVSEVSPTGLVCCCSSVLWLSLHFRVAQKSIFSSFCKFPISTAPRPELLLCKLLAHFSKKPCCRTMGFETIWAPYALVSVAMRYLRGFFFQSCWSSGFAINFMRFLQRRVFGSSNRQIGTPIELK